MSEPSWAAGIWAGRWAGWCTRHPWLVVVSFFIAAGASLHFAANHLTVNTDTEDMLDETLPFRQVEDRFQKEFPGLAHTLLLIVEAPTPEQASMAATSLHQRLRAAPRQFPRVFWPGGSEFLARNGLLLLPVDEVDALGDQLSRAQPLLARLAARTDLAGLFELLVLLQENAADGAAPIHRAVAGALESALAGEQRLVSWQRLVGDEAQADAPAREIMLVEPALEFDRVMAGSTAMQAIADIRRDLGLDRGPVRLYVTGDVALAYEELTTVLEGARVAGLLALVVVVAVMVVGLRSARLVGVALASLVIGLSLTVGFATWAVGRINLISIAFAVLYIGLGVNYAIHFLLRYREELAAGVGRQRAVVGAGEKLFGALLLSALTTAIGFFAFVPTAYAGVAELGLIAGVSMGITLLVSYTLLPALVGLLPPPPALRTDGQTWLPGSVIDLPLRRRAWVALAAVLVGLGAVAVSLHARFDSDPLNLRNQASESVASLRSLQAAGESGYRNLQLLAGGREEAQALTVRLQQLPAVRGVISLLSFVPRQQELKLALIEDLRWLLGGTVLQSQWRSPPSLPADLTEPLQRLSAALDGSRDPDAVRLRAVLGRFQDGMMREPALALSAHELMFDTLPATMRQFATALQVASPVKLRDIPDDLRDQWVSSGGAWMVQVVPNDEAREIEALNPFVEQVRSVHPSVTGGPVLELEAGRAVSSAFRQAMMWAVLGIFATLLVVLRDVGAAIKVLVPLLLGGAVTVALTVLVDVPFNFANVIALPLLLGVGVDNGVHLVYRHRAGALPGGNVLRTGTARAIVFGALTTALSFANLVITPHPGTASMGFILACGLLLMVAATLVVLPAILDTATERGRG